jgi:nucleotide-binding universal stress UspA family protein
MKKILLAIGSMPPDQKALQFALKFCRPIRAGLDVVHIIRQRGYRRYLKKIKTGLRQMNSLFEDAMVSVTFSEAGEHDMAEALRDFAGNNFKDPGPNLARTPIDYHFVVTPGDPEEEIIRYVEKHPDVVLTIYDTPPASGGLRWSADNQQRALARRIGSKLATPLVFVRG